LSLFILNVSLISIKFIRAQDIPPEQQQTFVYDVILWEDGPWESTEWTVFEVQPPFGSIYRGNFSSNAGGKIEVTVTGYHDKNITTEMFEDLNHIPYANIAFYDKDESGYALNFSISNVSMNEIGMILAYGFIGWNPGFQVSADWENQSQYALNKENLGYTEVDVEIFNQTSIITFKIRQLDGLGQLTILTYNKTNGILLEAYSEVALYRSHIRLQGMFPAPNLSLVGSDPNSSGNVSLSWNEISDATNYSIYRSDQKITELNQSVTKLNVVDLTTFDDTNLPSGIYYYAVVAHFGIVNSSLSNWIEVTVELPSGPINAIPGFELQAIFLGIALGLIIISRKRFFNK
jgi:hypothetical protein